MGGERFSGSDIQIQNHPQLENRGVSVSEVVASATPSNLDKIDVAAVRVNRNVILCSFSTEPSINPDENTPQNFKEIVAPNEEDTHFQRLAKWYLRHNGNPETTMKVFESLQVHRFQEVVKLFAKPHEKKNKTQTIDTIKDSGLSSLIDYATDKTLFSETAHLLGLGLSLFWGTWFATAGDEVTAAIWSAGSVLQTYSILGQRYLRARCERLINKALAKGKSIDGYEYGNTLNLKLPRK